MRNSGAGVRLKKTPFPISENEEKQEAFLRNQAALSPLALFFSLWAPRGSVSGIELEERTLSQHDGQF